MDVKKFIAWNITLYNTALNWLGPTTWTPKQADVDEWLEYYKKSTWLKAKDFATVMATAFGVTVITDGIGNTEVDYPSRQESEQDFRDFREAERAFNALEKDRIRVGHEYLNGYEAGRGGAERYCARFDRPTNSSYSWYNGWAVGEFDRLWREGKLCLLEEKSRMILRAEREQKAMGIFH